MSGLVVIPPTLHHKTGEPHVWLPGCTLLNTRCEQLFPLPSNIKEKLEGVLAPWIKPKPKPQPRSEAVTLTPELDGRYRGYAARGLRDEAILLAATHKGGRTNREFRAGCKLRWAVHHGYLTAEEFEDALLSACKDRVPAGGVRAAVMAELDVGSGCPSRGRDAISRNGAQSRTRTCKARRHLIYSQASLPLEYLCRVGSGAGLQLRPPAYARRAGASVRRPGMCSPLPSRTVSVTSQYLHELRDHEPCYPPVSPVRRLAETHSSVDFRNSG
jgi:hypothetical protein